jgi:endogenous inhibitor of DNA gyrase (YacG/DUF329 family)
LREQAKTVTCPGCGHPTLVRFSTLVRTFGHLPGSSTYDDEVPFACPHCKQLGLGFVDEESHWYDIEDQAKSPDGITEFSITLKCAQKGCLAHIEVLAPMIRCKDENQARDRVPSLIWAKYPQCELAYSLRQPLTVVNLHKFF